MSGSLNYRLALDLGTTSLGWAMVRLNAEREPCALIKAGVRIFSDGRNPKDGASLAVARREARAMRRRRDRLLRRKKTMMRLLVAHGFFPADPNECKALERLDPYELRARGVESALSGPEFARALFHINQRRGFKSNRKTDKAENDSGALKQAISQLRHAMQQAGSRTVGQWLYQRLQQGLGVRARSNGLKGSKLAYDLYIDRAMIEQEFDVLWATQSALNPALFTEAARTALRYTLLHQRPLKPVQPGRCTLLPEHARAPLALPSTQRVRLYQEVNHLRLLREGLDEQPLSREQRDQAVALLERHSRCSFTQLKKRLGLGGAVQFNLEDAKRTELKGNATSAVLGHKKHFGEAWFGFAADLQEQIVDKLLHEENESELVAWLSQHTGVDEARAETIARAGLPEGYGSLSQAAIARVLPALQAQVITYDKAVVAAGFAHHSQLSHAASTGEILPELPYYGAYLQRHVGFGSGDPAHPEEKRYGKIANPTVHIGLNQVRRVVNALIRRYGHPSEVIVEVARDLKQSKAQREEDQQRQADHQKRNTRLRQDAAAVLGLAPEQVSASDVQKLILWEELSHDATTRCCPYSGQHLSLEMVLSEQVEIEHILPFSQTLDDSMNNKTVALRLANRIKGNRTPWEAREDFAAQGWDVEHMMQRAKTMSTQKRFRFGAEAMTLFLKEHKGFLARALNDTRYLSRMACEYLSLICPQATRAIPGQMTALLRGKFGLNEVLGLKGEKNRNDHRHHAVDACVVAVTDQGLLQRFAQASASARSQQLNRLVEQMPLPWPSYREQVRHAVTHIWVSHKPDHGFEGAMHNDTAYGLLGAGRVQFHKVIDGQRQRVEESLKVIEISSKHAIARHGLTADGQPKPYKGYKGDSNYCMEIVRTPTGKWDSHVISTFDAYQTVRRDGLARLRHPHLSQSGEPLVMRLSINDTVRLRVNGQLRTVRLVYMASAGTLAFIDLHEANVDKRTRAKSLSYIFKTAGSLQKAQGRQVSISPIGEVRDPGFKG